MTVPWGSVLSPMRCQGEKGCRKVLSDADPSVMSRSEGAPQWCLALIDWHELSLIWLEPKHASLCLGGQTEVMVLPVRMRGGWLCLMDHVFELCCKVSLWSCCRLRSWKREYLHSQVATHCHQSACECRCCCLLLSALLDEMCSILWKFAK